VKIEDQIKLILQLNLDQNINHDDLIAENKQFVDDMRKIAQEKRHDVYNALDLMVRKHLVSSRLKL